jgi:hypothetical protein
LTLTTLLCAARADEPADKRPDFRAEAPARSINVAVSNSVADARSEAAIRVELKLRLQEALNSMDAVDREVLALRLAWETPSAKD